MPRRTGILFTGTKHASTFDFQQLIFCKRLPVYGISTIFVNVLDDQPPFEHVVGNGRKNGLFGNFVANYQMVVGKGAEMKEVG